MEAEVVMAVDMGINSQGSTYPNKISNLKLSDPIKKNSYCSCDKEVVFHYFLLQSIEPGT